MSTNTELQNQINEIALNTIYSILSSDNVPRPEDKTKLIKYVAGAALGKKHDE
jgi:hypothetical protein